MTRIRKPMKSDNTTRNNSCATNQGETNNNHRLPSESSSENQGAPAGGKSADEDRTGEFGAGSRGPNRTTPTSDSGGHDSKSAASVQFSEQSIRADGGVDIVSDLTRFQLDCLAAIQYLDDRPNGLDVKNTLKDLYPETIQHGRLYPNLDTLAEKGLIEKGKIDRRSNYYAMTDRGARALESRREWISGEATVDTQKEEVFA